MSFSAQIYGQWPIRRDADLARIASHVYGDDPGVLDGTDFRPLTASEVDALALPAYEFHQRNGLDAWLYVDGHVQRRRPQRRDARGVQDRSA